MIFQNDRMKKRHESHSIEREVLKEYYEIVNEARRCRDFTP